jgi:hypothetical protein
VRAGFTLLSSGAIQILWSSPAASLAVVANPGTLFIKTGLPLGYVDLISYGSGFKTSGSTSNIIENSVNDVPCIWRFGSGAGGSGGAGDANTILESLKNQFEKSFFQLLTPGIFSTDQDTKVDPSSTGAYSLVDDTFNFQASGRTLVTKNLLDMGEFGNNSNPLPEVEVTAYWAPGYVDTLANYAVSRDGGSTWNTLSMDRVGSTDAFYGNVRFAVSEPNTTILSQPSAGSARELNATTRQMVSQPFTLSASIKYLIRGATVSLLKLGSPSGIVFISVCADNAGQPGEVLSETLSVNVSSLATGSNSITLPDFVLPASSSTYHFKIRTDADYKSSYVASSKSISVQVSPSGSNPSMGYMKVYDSTGGWVTSATDNLTMTLSGIALDLRLRIISGSASKLSAFGVFYDKSQPAAVASGSLNIQEFEFLGSANTYQFTITKFLPHPDLLRVYDVFTGQCYVYGSFGLQGSTVVFESGPFYQPGQTVRLRFVQIEGTVFDNSDVNGLLLAANSLGSTNSAIDRSVAGKGIFLRRPDGTLREIYINNSDQLAVRSV